MRAILCTLLFATFAAAGAKTGAGLADPHQLGRDIDTYVRSASLEDLSLRHPIAGKASSGVVGWIDARVGVWLPKIDGDMATDGNNSVNLQDDLGLDDSIDEVVVMPMVKLSLGGLGVKIDGYILEFNGSGTVSGDFTFGGVTFTVNEDIDSRVKITNLRVVMTTPLARGGPIALYLLGGLSYFQLEGEVASDTLSLSASEKADVPIPVVGVLVQLRIRRIVLEVDATGLVVDYSGVSGMVLDIKASVGLTIAKILALRGGYRVVKFDGGSSDFDIDVTIDGYFVSLSVTF